MAFTGKNKLSVTQTQHDMILKAHAVRVVVSFLTESKGYIEEQPALVNSY